MSPKWTEKEAEVYRRFNNYMGKIARENNHSIGTAIEKLAEQKPDDIAILFGDRSWSWEQLNKESNKIANFFLNIGIKKQDSIALIMENSPEYLFITTGINKIQAISALINYNLRKQALIHSLNIVEPKKIIIDANFLDAFNEIRDSIPLNDENIYVCHNFRKNKHQYNELEDFLRKSSDKNPETTYNSILRETAFYIFTSGTTGLPKAIIHENLKLYTQGYLLGVSLSKINENDIIYMPTPLYHNLSIGIAWPTVFVIGAKLALAKRFSASKFWKEINRYKATFFYYVGEIPRYLLNQPPSEYEKNHTLKGMCGIGLRKEVWEMFKSRFNIENIYEFYGLTEGHRLLFNADQIPGMIGRYNFSGLVLVKVNPETGEFEKDDKGFFIKCKPGETGMALFKLDKKTFFTGYKDKQKTKERILHDVFRKGDAYFNTGDMLKLHKDKWVSFADRFGDTYRWKSENISTLEVESILNSHPAVAFSAAYGVKIPNTEGRGGMASIKLNKSIRFDINEFSKFVLESLPPYAIPLFIRFREKFEFTGPLKIKKISLQKEAYDLSKIKDPIYFWNSLENKYEKLTPSIYEDTKSGKIYF